MWVAAGVRVTFRVGDRARLSVRVRAGIQVRVMVVEGDAHRVGHQVRAVSEVERFDMHHDVAHLARVMVRVRVRVMLG